MTSAAKASFAQGKPPGTPITERKRSHENTRYTVQCQTQQTGGRPLEEKQQACRPDQFRLHPHAYQRVLPKRNTAIGIQRDTSEADRDLHTSAGKRRHSGPGRTGKDIASDADAADNAGRNITIDTRGKPRFFYWKGGVAYGNNKDLVRQK